MLTTKSREHKFSLRLIFKKEEEDKAQFSSESPSSTFLCGFGFLSILIGMGTSPHRRKKCITCHRTLVPGIVAQWEKFKHHEARVECDACHGSDHSKMKQKDCGKWEDKNRIWG
jgi:hypothetical protein